MLTRQPIPGEALERMELGGAWVPWGIVQSVTGSTVQCANHPAVEWCFGAGGCLGTNRVFRIAARAVVTMDDPFFN